MLSARAPPIPRPAADDGEDAILFVDELTQARRGVRTLIAMPAYNEESAIAKTVLGARRHADKVLVVDDGSEDETPAIAEALGAIVIRHEVNRGYGAALQTIFSTAGVSVPMSSSSSTLTASTARGMFRSYLPSSGGGTMSSSGARPAPPVGRRSVRPSMGLVLTGRRQ